MPGLRLGVPGKAPGRLRQPEWSLATNIVELTAAEPAVIQGTGTGNQTTGSFTVPAGTLVVVQAIAAFANSGLTNTISISDSGSHTWTQGVFASQTSNAGTTNWGGAVGIYWSYFALSATVTVTATFTNLGGGSLVAVRLFQGASQTQAGAASGSTKNLKGVTLVATAALTATAPGSIVLGLMNSPYSGITFSADGMTRVTTDYSDATDGVHLSAWQSLNPTGAPGSARFGGSIGASATVVDNQSVALEILPDPSIRIALDPPPNIDFAAPAGVAITTAAGPTTNIDLAAPAGASDTAAVGSVANIDLAAPAGGFPAIIVAQPQWLPPPPLRWMLEGHPVRPETGTQFVFSAPPALLSLVAPAGTASIAAAGPVSNIDFAAPAGNGSTTASGPVSNINLVALAGSADTSAAGVVSNISLAALAGSASVAVLGPASNINLVAPAGTGIVSAQGVAANIALAALAGSGTITAIGAVANIDLVAPPGSGVITGGGIVITGVPAEILLGTGEGVIQGPTARLTLDAPSGRPDVGVAGPVAAIALSAPAGSFSIVAYGVVANLNLVAPDGQAFVGAFVSAPAAQLLLQALAGSFTTTVNPPTPPDISLTAPAGGATTTAYLYPVTVSPTFGGRLRAEAPHFLPKIVGTPVTSWRVELVGPTWHAYPPETRWKAKV